MREICLILILLVAFSAAVKNCYQCQGINCQRTTYDKTQQCVDDLDICVSVYEGQTLQAQGCLQQLPIALRRKCDEREIDDDNDDEPDKMPSQCHKCLGSYCNNVAPDGFECIQCDSTKDIKCRSNPSAILPLKCPVSRTNNAYCYVSDDGKRTVRGCLSTLKELTDCLEQKDCLLCSPTDLQDCNVVQIIKHADDEDNSGNSGSGNGNGGNGNDGGNNGSGSGNGGNGSGGNGTDGNGNGNGGNNGGNGNGGSDGGNSGATGLANIIPLYLCTTIFSYFTISLLIC